MAKQTINVGSIAGDGTGDPIRSAFIKANSNFNELYSDKLATNGDGSALTGLTKAQVGLGNVENTSDANKPISTATQAALDLKLSTSGNGSSLTGLTKTQVGLGNADNTSDANKPVSIATQAALDLKLAISGNGSSLTGLTKAQVGLGNVDNTSDANKPISTATQSALNLKANLSITINNQTGTTYTMALADNGAHARFTNSSAISVTVPTNTNAAFPIGSTVSIFQGGTGKVTLVADSGVTINTASTLELRAQYSSATLIKVATNTWDIVGDMKAL